MDKLKESLEAKSLEIFPVERNELFFDENSSARANWLIGAIYGSRLNAAVEAMGERSMKSFGYKETQAELASLTEEVSMLTFKLRAADSELEKFYAPFEKVPHAFIFSPEITQLRNEVLENNKSNQCNTEDCDCSGCLSFNRDVIELQEATIKAWEAYKENL